MYIYITRTAAAPVRTGPVAIRGAEPSRGAVAPGAASAFPSTRRAPAPPNGQARTRRRVSPGWRRAPVLQNGNRAGETGRRQPVRVCVLDQRHTRRGGRPFEACENVRDRQRVGHDEDALLGPSEYEPKAAHVPRDDVQPALAASRRLVPRCSGRRPGAVLLEGAAFEIPVTRVVQLRHDEAGHRAAGERHVGGLPCPVELARHTQVDRIGGDLPPQLARLLFSPNGERPTHSDHAVHQLMLAEDALAVARQDHRLHSTCSRPTSAGDVQPRSRRPSSTSSRKSRRTWTTPSSPSAASAYATGRPTSTACAPSATARRTSTPRRTPLSSRISARPSTASTTGGSASIEAGTPSSWRPP